VERAFAALDERLRALPGVTGVASAGEMPLPGMNQNEMAIDGVQWPNDAPPWISYASVSDDYFRTMRIPLRRGRTFGPSERNGAPVAIVINESMARKYWPTGDALGARIRLGPNRTAPWATVVGVVGDVRVDAAQAEPASITYVSSRQDTWGSRAYFVRTEGDPSALVGAFRRELAALDPSVPLEDARPLASAVSDALAGRRFPVVLMGAFGALALLLASVGVYAMFASMAAAREREFGIRVALGASPRGIALTVLRQGGAWMALGLVAGGAGVVAVSRALRGLLYGTSQFDPVALGAAVLLLAVCGTVALLAPVRRATRVDPISVLR
jgi:predicted permease